MQLSQAVNLTMVADSEDATSFNRDLKLKLVPRFPICDFETLHQQQISVTFDNNAMYLLQILYRPCDHVMT